MFIRPFASVVAFSSVGFIGCGAAAGSTSPTTSAAGDPQVAQRETPTEPTTFATESAAATDADASVVERRDWFALVVGFAENDEAQARASAIALDAFAASESPREGFQLANARLHAEIGGPNATGVAPGGASAAALHFVDDRVEVLHVGSVRVYRWRDGGLSALTVDHSLVEDFIRQNDLSAEEAEEVRRNAPHRSVVVRALGPHETVEVEAHQHETQSEDEYWIVSGAIPYALDDAQIAEFVRAGTPSELVARVAHPERSAVVLRVRVP